MSDAEQGGSMLSILSAPGPSLSRWYVALGGWGLFLGLLNLMGAAHQTLKVAWAGYLTVGFLGEGLVHNMAYHPMSDTVFLGSVILVMTLGLKSIAGEQGGIQAWLTGLVNNDTWPALVSTEDGWEKTFGAWSILGGIVFYFWWGVKWTTWVDPGVYAVSIALIALGISMKAASAVRDEEPPKE